jgi:CRISPR-associated protein Cmr3
MPKYLIQLSPRGQFFFGGNKAYTASGEEVFYSSSLHYPQQTAVLGMLRFALIKQHDALNDQIKAKECAGESGFTPEKCDMGKIISISPIFLMNRKTKAKWLPAGADVQSYTQLDFQMDNSNPIMPNYDHKKWVVEQLTDDNSIRNLDKLMVEVNAVGNQKARDGKSQDDAFFMQKRFVLAKHEINEQKDKKLSPYKSEITFAFYAEFSEEIKFDKVDSVFLGADQSVFGFKIIEDDPSPIDFDSLMKKNQDSKKIILLSDTYIEKFNEFKSKTDFIMGASRPFKYMKSSLKSSSFFANKRSELSFNLLTRGSVIFPKAADFDDIINKISNSNFKTIGYNHFKIV